MVKSSPLFLVVREEYVALFDRLYDSFQWLHENGGDHKLVASYDIKQMDTFPTIREISFGQNKWYEGSTVVYNLASLLLLPPTGMKVMKLYESNVIYFKSDNPILVGVQEVMLDSDSSVCPNSFSVTVMDLWKGFLQTLFRKWSLQNTDIATTIFILTPDYFPACSRYLLVQCCSNLGMTTASSLSMFNILPRMVSLSNGSFKSCISLELSETLLYASLTDLVTKKITKYTQVILSDGSDPMTILSKAILSRMQPQSSTNLSSYEEHSILRSIRLQCRNKIEQSYDILVTYANDYEEALNQNKSLFSITINHPQIPIRCFDISYIFLDSVFSSSTLFGTRLIQLIHEVNSWINQTTVIYNQFLIIGLYSSIGIIQHELNRYFPQHKCIRFRLNHIAFSFTEEANSQSPTICNDFHFLDHNLSVAIDGGFCHVLFSRGIALPSSISTTLYYSICQSSSLTLYLLRGDSCKQEENIVLITQSVSITNQTHNKINENMTNIIADTVAIAISVELDEHCNVEFHILDAYGQSRSVSLSSTDFFNTSIDISHKHIQIPQTPSCSRKDYSHYQGEFQEFRPHGFGRYYDWLNQLKYEGTWNKGQYDGRGVYYFTSGNIYEGSFKNGCFHGPGTVFDNQGIVIKRDYFVNEKIDDSDLKDVVSTTTHLNISIDNSSKEIQSNERLKPSTSTSTLESSVYLPQSTHTIMIPSLSSPAPTYLPQISSSSLSQTSSYFIADTRDQSSITSGVMYNAIHQRIYKGEMRDGLYHGKGTLYYLSGVEQYQGSFQEGVFHGLGVLFYPSGNTQFCGYYINGKKNGQGETYYDQETRVTKNWGYFVRDKREGLGEDFDSKGTSLYSGYFHLGLPSLIPVIFNWGITSEIPRVWTRDAKSILTLFNSEFLILAVPGSCLETIKEGKKNINNKKEKTQSFSIVSMIIILFKYNEIDDKVALLEQKYLPLLLEITNSLLYLNYLNISDSSITIIEIIENTFLHLKTFSLNNLNKLQQIIIHNKSLCSLDVLSIINTPSLIIIDIGENCLTNIELSVKIYYSKSIRTAIWTKHKEFTLINLPSLQMISIGSGSMIDFVTFVLENLPSLDFLRIGTEDTVSCCFSFAEDFILSNLPVLTNVSIFGSSLASVKRLKINNLPKLHSFLIKNNSLSYLEELIIYGVSEIETFKIHRVSKTYKGSLHTDCLSLTKESIFMYICLFDHFISIVERFI